MDQKEHIDQQATALDEAEALIRKNADMINGYLARIDELETGLDEAVKVVRQNAGTISALRVQIAELESQIIHQTGASACRIEERERLQKQIAALREIAISERERRHIADMSRFGFVLDSDASPDPRKLAKDQLTEEHPEAFR